MIVNFTKMHGLGNDFVIIDLITQGARIQKTLIKRIADRKFGIGCDQVILVTPPTTSDVDFYYKIFNADGQEVEQCGNGVRCAAKFFRDSGLTNKNNLIADCAGGTVKINLDSQHQVTVNLGKNYSEVISKELNNSAFPKEIHTLSVGNPHGVCIVDDLTTTPIVEWGKTLSTYPIFPDGANIGFMQIVDRDHINLRVFERGVGPTHACGSGACAAVLVGKSLNLLNNKVTVNFEFGKLIISLDPNDLSLSMTGPANNVFIGRFKV